MHDICDRLCQMTGTLTFVIIPKGASASASGGLNSAAGAAGPASAAAAVNASNNNLQRKQSSEGVPDQVVSGINGINYLIN